MSQQDRNVTTLLEFSLSALGQSHLISGEQNQPPVRSDCQLHFTGRTVKQSLLNNRTLHLSARVCHRSRSGSIECFQGQASQRLNVARSCCHWRRRLFFLGGGGTVLAGLVSVVVAVG